MFFLVCLHLEVQRWYSLPIGT